MKKACTQQSMGGCHISVEMGHHKISPFSNPLLEKQNCCLTPNRNGFFLTTEFPLFQTSFLTQKFLMLFLNVLIGCFLAFQLKVWFSLKSQLKHLHVEPPLFKR